MTSIAHDEDEQQDVDGLRGPLVGELGPIVAAQVVSFGGDAESPVPETESQLVAVDVSGRESRLWRLQRREGGLVAVVTGETSPVAVTTFVAAEVLPPPTLEDEAEERLAQALADMLLAEVGP